MDEFGTLRTRPIWGQEEGRAPEPGVFEAKVYGNLEELKQSQTPKAYLAKIVATNLAHQVQATTVPDYMWSFHLNRTVQKILNLPPVLSMDSTNQ